MPLKLDDRIAGYDGGLRLIGKVETINQYPNTNGWEIGLRGEKSGALYLLNSKQCRRLKPPKPRRRVKLALGYDHETFLYIDEYSRQALHRIPSISNQVDWIEFIEVKKK